MPIMRNAAIRAARAHDQEPPDEAMTILELLLLHLSVDGPVKAIACDQRLRCQVRMAAIGTNPTCDPVQRMSDDEGYTDWRGHRF